MESRLLVGYGDTVRQPVILQYAKADPFAVRVVFPYSGGGLIPAGEVEWIVSRDLLQAGMESASGVGDVHIWPLPHRGVVALQLTSNDGTAVLELDAAAVELFLTSTEELVTSGSESHDIDSILGRIFAVSS